MDEVAEVLNASRDRFLSFLTRRVEGREAAEEILQSAFTKIMAKGATPRDEKRVDAWFYRILRNEVIDHYRRRGAEARSLETLAREAGSETDLDQDLDRAICACVRDVIPTLRPEHADILRRADLEEGSLADVARHLGLTANNARVRLHRARAALRERLGEVCGACTEHGCLSCACRRKGRP
jgi:RNA polymerase sigma factor (sigma-70 family)